MKPLEHISISKYTLYFIVIHALFVLLTPLLNNYFTIALHEFFTVLLSACLTAVIFNFSEKRYFSPKEVMVFSFFATLFVLISHYFILFLDEQLLLTLSVFVKLLIRTLIYFAGIFLIFLLTMRSVIRSHH